MENYDLLKIEVNKFDLTGFIDEISTNLRAYINPKYICSYMKSSNLRNDIYVDLEDDLDEISDTYEEDLLKNDRILYIKFVLDLNLLFENEGYFCGDGDRLEEYKYENIDYGEFCHEENGFLVKSNSGILTIQRATYGAINPFQFVAKIVKTAGDFDRKLIDFIEKYKKSA